MRKLNTSGFSLIEGLLLVIAVTLIAGVGYYVYSANNNADSQSNISDTQTDKKKSKVPSGWVQFKDQSVSFYHPGDWERSSLLDEDSLAAFKLPNQDAVSVFNTSPRIFYSANGPYICQLDGDVWQDYEYQPVGSGKTNEYTLTDKANVCEDKVRQRDSAGAVSYEAEGGAPGLVKRFVATEVSGGYIVFSAVQSYNSNEEAGISQVAEDMRNRLVDASDDIASAN